MVNKINKLRRQSQLKATILFLMIFMAQTQHRNLSGGGKSFYLAFWLPKGLEPAESGKTSGEKGK